MADVRALLRMAGAMVELYCASFRQVPKRIVLDIDDTFDTVHGGQQLRLFNAHHDEYGFQPIVVFGPYLAAYASEMAWREDKRRVSNGEQYLTAAEASLQHPVSRVWKGYWQRANQ